MKKAKMTRLALQLLTLALVYCGSYAINSLLGGYWLKPESDGQYKYSVGLSIPNAMMWQPRFGHLAQGNSDFLGLIYAPLIQIERLTFRKTVYIGDDMEDAIARVIQSGTYHPDWEEEVQAFLAKAHQVAPQHERPINAEP